MDHNTTETALLYAARRMDREALLKIFDLYATPLYQYALCSGCDPLTADRIAGDVFEKLLDQLCAGQGPVGNLRSYLFEITYHLIMEASRDRKRNRAAETIDPSSADVLPVDWEVESRIPIKVILPVIQRKLSSDQRHVILLRFMEGFSLNEIAFILRKSAGNIKVIQRRAIRVVRKSLKSQVIKAETNPSTLETDVQP